MDEPNIPNLDRDLIQCEKDGFGCSYGKWKSTQEHIQPIPKNTKKCKYCGKPFVPRKQKNQVYCDINCQREMYKEKRRQCMQELRRKQKIEVGGNDGEHTKPQKEKCHGRT